MTIEVVFDHENDSATVTLPDGSYELPHVPSGSGAKYSDDTITFWTRGVDAFVEVDGETVIGDCQAEPVEDQDEVEAKDEAEATDSGADASTAGTATPDVIDVTYACDDGVMVDAVYDNVNRTVTVTLPDGVLELPQAESASGARYSDGTTTFWSKGDEAFVQVDGETVIEGCVAQ